MKLSPDFKHIVTGADVGAISHRGIANVYTEMLYVTRNGIRSLTKDIYTDDWNAEPISDIIAPTIKNYVFDEDTVSIYYEKEDEIYVCAFFHLLILVLQISIISESSCSCI